MRTLVLVHRWLGVALCLLFAMWFTSGIALHFVPYPKFDTAERLAAEAPLAVSSGCCVSMTVAMNAAGVEAAAGRRVRLAMLDARPVYPLATWSSRAKWSVHHQWNPWRPFHRVALGDEAGTVLYVSAQTGEVVRDTNRTERIVGWIGAGPHWLYPTVLRRLPAARRQTVIWISAAGGDRRAHRVAARRAALAPARVRLREPVLPVASLASQRRARGRGVPDDLDLARLPVGEPRVGAGSPRRD